MNAMRLLPVGIALLSTLPLAAQTNQSLEPPVPPSTTEKTLPPLLPLENLDMLDTSIIIETHVQVDDADFEAERREFEADAKEFELDRLNFEREARELQLDAKEFELDRLDFQLDAEDFQLDAEDFKLDAEIFKNLPEGVTIRIDSLNQELREILNNRESMRAERTVQREVRRLQREIRERNRQLQRMQSQMSGDTTALRESLQQAQQALDAARQSLSEISPNVLMLPDMSIPDVNITIPNISVVCKSVCRAVSHGTTSTVIVEDGDSTSATANHWKRGKRIVLITRNDSTQAPDEVLGVRSSSQIVIRNVTDANGEESNKTIYIRSFGSEGTQFSDFPIPPTPPQMAPFKLGDNLIMIGNDSLQLHDGSSEQMLIRVYRDSSNAPNVHTSVVVITMARGRKVDTLSGGTSDVPMLNELSSASSSAGYTLEANRPNPFSESTTINFVVPKDEHVNLTVFDAAGKPVKVLKDETVPAGAHSVSFDARDLPSGIYLYRLVGGSFSETKTMTITK